MNRRSRGFTLLEVLVALAVLGIALAALTHNISVNVDNAAYLRERTFAHWVAMNKVTELQVSGDWPGPGTQRGDALLAKRQWYWSATVANTEDPDVRRLDVAVFVTQDGKQPLATLVSYVGRPMAAKP